jgi:electron transfer flavoprotein alpha subunit
MAILFLVEIADGKVKKASFEAASYAAKYASTVGKEAVGLALGSIDDASLSALGVYGAKKIIHANNAGFDMHLMQVLYAKAIAEVATQIKCRHHHHFSNINRKSSSTCCFSSFKSWNRFWCSWFA